MTRVGAHAAESADFTWYGRYDVEIRKDGYDTLKTPQMVKAPWWGWVPFDLFAELVRQR